MSLSPLRQRQPRPPRGAAAVLVAAAATWATAASCSEDTAGKGADVAGGDADGAGADIAQPKGDPAAAAALANLPIDETWALTGLTSQVHVVRTESNVPHIYAAHRDDLARVMGFVAARDRFFLMDMMRRLGLGRLSEAFGSAGLASDATSRGSGMTAVADRVLTQLRPELKALLVAYAEGVNAYIAAVAAGQLPPPSEWKVAAGLLGYKTPVEAMRTFDVRDMAGMLAVVLFQQGYETDDIRRATQRRALAAATAGKPDAALRAEALETDVLDRADPLTTTVTTAGFGRNGAWKPPAPPPPGPPPAEARAPRAPAVPQAMLARLQQRMGQQMRLLGKPERGAFGSNMWAVSGSKSANGQAILSSDGHLALSVPSLFWRIGLDTRVLGGGDIHQLGLTFAGLPLLGAGTNGHIAWSNTYLYGDITDFYAETLTLDKQGRPASVLHQGEPKPITGEAESYQTAKIALLGSPGGPVVRTRYTTWDGRRLVAIEGRPATVAELADPSKLAPGKAIVDVLGDAIVAGDEDGDGKVSGITMDLTTLDLADTPGAIDAIGRAKHVGEFLTATRDFVGWAQNMMAVDGAGSIAYTSFHASPCRGYLPRTPGGFAAGADPRDLLDGSQYRGFTIPVADGRVQYGADADPYRCVIPPAAWPEALQPAAGWLVNANNDISGTSLDGVLGNDPYYLGGAWTLGFRAARIEQGVATAAAAGPVSAAQMATLQGETRSSLGCRLVGPLRASLAAAEGAAAGASAHPAATALAALWLADAATLTTVADKLATWQQRGCPAASGVTTFYAPDEAGKRPDAVATMLANAWIVEALHAFYDDEGADLDPMEALRAFVLAVEGRGAGNPNKLKGFVAVRQESVLFDRTDTAAVEHSDVLLLQALHAALARLRAKPAAPGLGGFGSDDVEQWLWGLRHHVRFDSILADFLADVPGLAGLLDMFAITPELHPLADALPPGDPRATLPGFPRDGDYDAVDAAAPRAIRSAAYGPSADAKAPRDMSYAHGPIMRMVIALGPADAAHPVGRVEGRNILPGGQSALTDSPFFSDQVLLWLGNQTQPMRFDPADVFAHATAHEVFVPAR